MIINIINFMYLFRIHMILIEYQQNLLQIVLIIHEKIKNKIRTSEPEIGQKFKNTQAEIQIRGSYKKKACIVLGGSLFASNPDLTGGGGCMEGEEAKE